MTGWLLPVAVLAWIAGGRRRGQIVPYALGALLGPVALLAAGVWAPAGAAVRSAWRRIGSAAAEDAVRRGVPVLLTDLGMAAEAGQPLHAALRDAADYSDGPLAAALQRFGSRVDAGASVAQALEALRRDLGTPQTDRLIGLLSRDAQLGLPLAASVARYRRNWLSEAAHEADRTVAYLPYVFTAVAGLLLLEGIALAAAPWLMSLLGTL